MSFKEFMDLGLTEFFMKLNSIPENEPLYKIIQSDKKMESEKFLI